MNGRDLINSIMLANTDSLKYTFVALEKTSIVRMLSSKVLQTSDKLLKKEEVDRYQKYLEKEVQKIQLSDDELRMEILLALAKITEVPAYYWDTRKGLFDFGENVINAVIREYKKFDKKFEGSTIDELIKYKLEKMFATVDKQYAKASIAEQEEYQQRVLQFIEQLPQHQQEKLRKDLGIEHFSQRVIAQVLATGGVSVIFSSLVHTMGFSFYIGASSLLASSASLFGLTLPFAAYTTLSSFIAVLAAPLFVIGVLTFSSFYFLKQKSKLTKMMLPLTIMQLLLSYITLETNRVRAYDSIINVWKNDITNYKQLLHDLNENKLHVKKLQNEISEKKKLIQSINRDIHSHQFKISLIKNNMKAELKNHSLAATVQDLQFITCYREILQLKEEVNQLSRKEIGYTGIVSKLKAHFKNTVNVVVLKERERKIGEKYDTLVDIVLKRNISICENEQREIQTLMDQINQLQSKIKTTNAEISIRKSKLNNISEIITNIEKQIKFYQNKYYGLSSIDQQLLTKLGE